VSVQPIQSSIAEETFQTQLVSKALTKLGYDVQPTKEVDYNVAYTSVAAGDATFLAVNWDQLHSDMYNGAGGDKKFYREGQYVTGAAQGYLIDKKTADQYHITNIEQLKDPKIAKLFDTNNDGKADLAGCTPGWGCEASINYQLKAYGLNDGANYGFPVNNMQIVANKTFAEKNPAAAKLFAEMKLPIADVNAQNLRMHQGENSEADIERHVNGWIKAHQATFDGWVDAAKKAADTAK